VNRRFHPLELVHAQQLDEAVQRLDQAVAEARRCADVPPDSDVAAKPHSGEQLIEDIYRTAVDIRLDLIYSATISGELRKRWANRMGEINLRSPQAAREIDALLADLAVHQTNPNGALDFAIGQVSQALKRLRTLCVGYATSGR
jgi:hypothetical protein